MADRKLTDDQVRELRAAGKLRRELLDRAARLGNRALALKYQVGQATVEAVIQRKTYRDVD